jgi:hypothetical protein
LIPTMPSLPIVLSFVGVAGLAVAGYLGGELVFKHGVAVESKSLPVSEGRSTHDRAA